MTFCCKNIPLTPKNKKKRKLKIKNVLIFFFNFPNMAKTVFDLYISKKQLGVSLNFLAF